MKQIVILDLFWIRPSGLNYDIFAPKPLWGLYLMQGLNVPVALASLVPCIWRGRYALPGRLALRWLWACIRMFYVLTVVEILWDATGWTPASRMFPDLIACGVICLVPALTNISRGIHNVRIGPFGRS